MSISFKSAALTLSVFCLLLIAFLAPKTSAFDLFGNACSGKGANSTTCQGATAGKTNTASDNVVLNIISDAANIVAALTGAIAVIMIIVGGFSLVTSGGSPEKAKNAQQRIVFSLVGLVVVALGWTATRFIIDRVIQ